MCVQILGALFVIFKQIHPVEKIKKFEVKIYVHKPYTEAQRYREQKTILQKLYNSKMFVSITFIISHNTNVINIFFLVKYNGISIYINEERRKIPTEETEKKIYTT